MTRVSLLAAAAVAMLAAACAGQETAATSSTSASQTVATAGQTGAQYSTAQLQSYVAARDALNALPAAQRQDQTQIAAVMQVHNIGPVVYTAIDARARTDQTLANRIAAISVGTSFTDDQLRAFTQASAEIDPINRTLATATPEQREAAGAQIRDVLARNNLTLEVYNGIATRARTDTELAARIATLSVPAAAPETPG